jgi:hypothetical protein
MLTAPRRAVTRSGPWVGGHPLIDVDVEHGHGGVTMTFPPVDLRPHGEVVLSDDWSLLVAASRTDPVVATWTATAAPSHHQTALHQECEGRQRPAGPVLCQLWVTVSPSTCSAKIRRAHPVDGAEEPPYPQVQHPVRTRLSTTGNCAYPFGHGFPAVITRPNAAKTGIEGRQRQLTASGVGH